MKRSVLVLLAVSVIVVAAASWYVYRTLSIDAAVSAPAAPPQRVQVVNGETVLIIGSDGQRAGHIEVAPLAATTVTSQTAAYGSVIDPQPLFDMRNRLAAARADRQSVRAQTDAARAQYERTRALFEDNRNVSQKNLQEAQAARVTSETRLQAADAAEKALEAALRRQFGSVLARASTAADSKLLQQLESAETALLRVTLPAGLAAPDEITIDVPGEPPFPARKVSPSPQADPAVQGIPYFYAAEHPLPIGAHVTAHVRQTASPAVGLLIPESAIVWYGGERWVYENTAPNRFTRRHVASTFPTDGGVVAAGDVRPGAEIVVEGAELLLSEELRPQGPGTQCKDPECD